MSIPSSYLTTMAWEKFVEKHGDFMRNFKTKVENEKRNKKLCFRLKWWFWKEFGSFCSRFTTSLSHPRPSWHSVIELAFQDLNHMGRMVRVDINQRAFSVTWRRRLYSFITLFTPSTSWSLAASLIIKVMLSTSPTCHGSIRRGYTTWLHMLALSSPAI